MHDVNTAYSALPEVQPERRLRRPEGRVRARPTQPGDTTLPRRTARVRRARRGRATRPRARVPGRRPAARLPADGLKGHIKLPDVEKLAGDAGLAPAVRVRRRSSSTTGSTALVQQGQGVPEVRRPDSPTTRAGDELRTENAGGLVNPNQALIGDHARSRAGRGRPRRHPQRQVRSRQGVPGPLGQDPRRHPAEGHPRTRSTTSRATPRRRSSTSRRTCRPRSSISFEWKPDLKQDEPLHIFEPRTRSEGRRVPRRASSHQSLTDPNKRSGASSAARSRTSAEPASATARRCSSSSRRRSSASSRASGQKTHVDVKINDVTFAGALKFVDELRKYLLENLGDAFGVRCAPDRDHRADGPRDPGGRGRRVQLSNLVVQRRASPCRSTGDPVRVRFGLSTREQPVHPHDRLLRRRRVASRSRSAPTAWRASRSGSSSAAQLALEHRRRAGRRRSAAGIYLKIDEARTRRERHARRLPEARTGT